ncbi:MAG: nitrilase-related carbon-nitrogen hydrolase, partial [Planctomycetota bacterium]
MSRIVRSALLQIGTPEGVEGVQAIKKAMIDKHVAMLEQAAGQGAQLVCFQELFYGPYFCAEQDKKWYELTERV